MNTQEFLNLIWPNKGATFFVARIRPETPTKKKATVHVPVPDADAAVDTLDRLAAAYPDWNMYYAMASYKGVVMNTHVKEDGTTFQYEAGRLQSNVAYVKSFWLDIDVNKPGCYPTMKEALDDLKLYYRSVGLPAPLIVGSGGGMHAYWLLSETIPTEEWMDIVKYQRAAWKFTGLKADSQCDQDSARVLRPIGYMNVNHGKPVVLLKDARNYIAASDFKAKLVAFCKHNNIDVVEPLPEIPPHIKKMQGNLSGIGDDYPKSFAVNVVLHCKQMKKFSEDGGATYADWFNALGVLQHCEDGEQYAHEWAAKSDDYDFGETQKKMESWNAGPTTCDKFRADSEEGCAGCKHSCRSPIQLGQATIELEVAPNMEEVLEKQAEMCEAAAESCAENPYIDGRPAHWDPAFDIVGDTVVTTRIINKVPTQIKVASPVFYPVDIIIDAKEQRHIKIAVHTRGEIRYYTFPCDKLGSHMHTKAFLASAAGVFVMDSPATELFFGSHLRRLVSLKEETRTFSQFGWNEKMDGFVVGNKMILENGETEIQLNAGVANPAFAKLSEQAGDVKEWVDAVEEMFNRKNGEPYQLAILSAFASILTPLLSANNWHGIPLALTSLESGVGKSTVFNIAHSIYCKQATHSTIISGTTVNAGVTTLEYLKNIPCLFDDMARYYNTPKSMGGILYDIANGAQKKRLERSGELQIRRLSWSMIPGITANCYIHGVLAKDPSTAEATQARVFEIFLDSYPRMDVLVPGSDEYAECFGKHRALAAKLFAGNYGVIGREWERYVIKNKYELIREIEMLSLKIANMNITGSGSADRFYENLVTLLMVACRHAVKLGFVKFDRKRLFKWSCDHMRRASDAIVSLRDTPEDLFNKYTNWMTGKLIVTRSFKHDGRTSAEEVVANPPRGFVAGRYSTGSDKEMPRLVATIQSLREWCSETGNEFSLVKKKFLDNGLILLRARGVNTDSGAVRMAIGRGAHGFGHLSNPWCYELKASASALQAVPDPEEAEALAA